jgi:hypothetical protein
MKVQKCLSAVAKLFGDGHGRYDPFNCRTTNEIVLLYAEMKNVTLVERSFEVLFTIKQAPWRGIILNLHTIILRGEGVVKGKRG